MVELLVSDPHLLLLEQHLERQALGVYRSAHFLGVLKAYGIAPEIPAQISKEDGQQIRARDIWAARHKMLAAQDLGQERFCLSLRATELVTAFQEWLTTSYTPRYRYLTADTQRTWLDQVTLLVVVRYLMEEKYARFLTEGHSTFADPWVGHVMEHLYVDHQLPDLVFQHLKRMNGVPAEQWRSMIASFLKELDDHTSRYPFVQPEPLPPLPRGVTPPFLLPTPVVREQHSSEKPETWRMYPKGGA